MKKAALIDKVRMSYRRKRKVILGLSAIVLLMLYFFKDASLFLRTISFVGFIVVFYVVDHWFDIRFKKHHYLFIILIGITSFLFSSLYYLNPNYDKLLHFFQPILITSIVFFMVNRLRIDLKWKLVFTFFIVVGLLGLFEMGEYTLDYLFDMKMQGVYIRDMAGLEKFNLVMNEIDDTMIDMFFGVFGTCFYGLAVLIYYRYYKRSIRF